MARRVHTTQCIDATVEKISIAFPPEMVALLRHAVATEEYASTSEVRDALRDWSHKRKLQQNGVNELRQFWQEARADRSASLDSDEVFDKLERKYRALAEAAG